MAAGPAPQTRHCCIHRDYHHGNTLWSRGRLTGVVDWSQASWGPGPVDLAPMRWNLALDYGIQAAEDFLAIYRTLTTGQSSIIPTGDVVTVIDLVGNIDPPTPLPSGDLAALETHVAAVLAHL